MKKRMVLILTLAFLVSLVGCNSKKEDILHLGLNAEITEINSAQHCITVKDIDENQNVFGGESVIDCSNAVQRDHILYVKYNGNGDDVKSISFEELAVGDKIILNIYESELQDHKDNFIVADSVQLATQRLD